MKTLGQLAKSHDNNFNLLRMLAAWSVLVSHSYPLVYGAGTPEPFARVGYSLGGVAVDVFFITSGFLVTGSVLRLRALKAFALARAWRIFPALVVMVVVVGLVMGPSLTSHSMQRYFSDHHLYQFLVNNVLLLFGLEYRLPGVFAHNPMHPANGSLWTLPLEVRCYLSLMVLWALAARSAVAPERFFKRASVIIIAICLPGLWLVHAPEGQRLLAHLGMNAQPSAPRWHVFRLFFMFFSGVALWLWRERIPMRHSYALACALGLAAAALWPILFFVLYPLCVGYLVMYCAYVPAGVLRRYNRLGDYSYGTYIYAFPAQQSVVQLIPGITPVMLMALATPLTLVLAAISWHAVEQPSLARKKRQLAAPIAAAPSP